MTGSFITDEELKQLGIELNTMDFFTGVTAPYVTRYFMPRSDRLCKVTKRGPDYDDDYDDDDDESDLDLNNPPVHDKFARARAQNCDVTVWPLQRLLEAEFRKYRGGFHGISPDCISYCLYAGEWVFK